MAALGTRDRVLFIQPSFALLRSRLGNLNRENIPSRCSEAPARLAVPANPNHSRREKEMPGIRLLVSYADLNQGHEGKIYQASNWLFVGTTGHEAGIMLNRKLTHRRTINSKYGTSDIDWLKKRIDPCARRYEGKPKFKYLLPLDDEITDRVRSLSRPYPNAPQAKRTLRLDSIQERAV